MEIQCYKCNICFTTVAKVILYVICFSHPASGSTTHDDTFELKLTANLNAFSISVCDQTCRIADIRIQGKVYYLSVKRVNHSKKCYFPLHMSLKG